ncbi:hypothetical protein C6B38_03560 [Spiroplasma sp. ChiS]|uniref:pentapeptide repeat-containing protein n=1 Tax=Spiroplasma sp. ChiS TaxID=2099885 RepID=UPI000CF97023|nr:pentapeptide repeat-containing protein [Spiroplasma sp. ChiS]PQP78847.1 hypothetical protein C6B38_03560 [Spiroplasma sp. ChiS]
MKTLHEMIKDLTGIDVEQDKISDYLEEEVLYLQGAYLQGVDLYRADLHWADLQVADLRYANLSCANLKGIKITKNN